MLKNRSNLLFFVIVLALFLRLGGITHGFPYILHPDEPTIVRSALAIRFNPNPGHFDWPHLYIYFNYFIYMGFAYLRDVLISFNLKTAVLPVLPIIWNDSLIFYLITRIVSAILGSLTLIPIYLTGKKLFNEKVGLLAAFAYATFPAQIWYSHYTMPDTPMVFLLAWGIYYCAEILTEKDYSNYALAGFFFGLSASTKYNGILGIFLIPLAHLLAPGYAKAVKDVNGRKLRFFDTLILLVAAGLSSILGFVIGTPYAAFDYKNFLRKDNAIGALWQFTNVGQLNILHNLNLISNRIIMQVGEDVAYLALLATAVVGIVTLVKLLIRKIGEYDYAAFLLFTVASVLLVYVASHEKARAHYFFITYPFLAVLFGYFVNIVFNVVRKKSFLASFIVLGVFIFIPLYFSSIVTLRFINNDTRLDLARWGAANLSVSGSVIYDTDDLKGVLSSVTKNYKSAGKFVPGEYSDYYITGKGTDPGYGFVEIFRIDNHLRLGPEIRIYKRAI